MRLGAVNPELVQLLLSQLPLSYRRQPSLKLMRVRVLLNHVTHNVSMSINLGLVLLRQYHLLLPSYSSPLTAHILCSVNECWRAVS